MPVDTATGPASTKRLWAGRIISTLPILFMLFDSVIKLMKLPPVLEAFAHLGLPITLAPGIGVLGLLCTAVYLFPRTAVLGAVLLTGYLGGATAIHVRSGTPFYMPLLVGAFVWGGLYLRDARLRTLVPLRSEPVP